MRYCGLVGACRTRYSNMVEFDSCSHPLRCSFHFINDCFSICFHSVFSFPMNRFVELVCCARHTNAVFKLQIPPFPVYSSHVFTLPVQRRLFALEGTCGGFVLAGRMSTESLFDQVESKPCSGK